MGLAERAGEGMGYMMPSIAGEPQKSSGPVGSIMYVVPRLAGLAEAKASPMLGKGMG
jgi:hypothetical protein